MTIMELDLSINGSVKPRKLSLSLPQKLHPPEEEILAPPLLTPGSVFKVSKLPVVKDSLVNTVMFSLWDNVLGPKINRVWTNEEVTCTLTKHMMHISSHTLNGEICRDPQDPSIDTKFYHMTDRGYCITAFVFNAVSCGSMAVHSVSVLVPLHLLSTYMPYYDLCTAYMTRCLACLRVQLSLTSMKRDDALEDFSLKIQNLIELFNSLSLSGVPDTICLSDTYFHMRPPDSSGVFLKRALTSHIMTCGHIVVLGRTSAEINPLIATLCLFSSNKDRSCSRYVHDDQGWPYEPQLAVQGVIVRDNHKPPLRVSDVLAGPYPTTIVDLLRGEVVQSPPCHQHISSRHEMLKTELSCVIENTSPATGIYPTSKNIFLTVDPAETFITSLYNELIETRSDLKIDRIGHFMRLMERRALVLIKYVESSSQKGENYMKASVDKMRRHLDLKMEGDFRMVLATAERLKDGIYGFVLGDPKMEKDQFLLDTI